MSFLLSIFYCKHRCAEDDHEKYDTEWVNSKKSKLFFPLWLAIRTERNFFNQSTNATHNDVNKISPETWPGELISMFHDSIYIQRMFHTINLVFYRPHSIFYYLSWCYAFITILSGLILIRKSSFGLTS